MTVIILYPNIYSQDIKVATDNFIRENLGEKSKYEFEKYFVPSDVKSTIEKTVKQKFTHDYIYLYEITSEGITVSYGLLDNVYGKTSPITFMVLYDLKGSIISSGIIIYRERHGGEVQRRDWNEQFKGRDAASGFEIGKDIQSISGATISSNSVAKGVRKLSLLIEHIIAGLSEPE
jgi:Na+-translocating ferredoxin:NAD+ oxidoreductase RnfG subunit